MKLDVLILVPPQAGLSPLAGFDSLAEHFELHYAPDGRRSGQGIAQVGSKIRAVVMSGGVGLRLISGQVGRGARGGGSERN